MQQYEEAPPPYPGAIQNAPANIVTSKGDYRGVPVYEIGSNPAPVYGQPTYQQGPVEPTIVRTFPTQVGPNPIQCICPQCHQPIVTKVAHDSGSFAWLMCLLLTVIGCIPCCVIPFCMTSCQDATHTCPFCSAYIGRRKVL